MQFKLIIPGVPVILKNSKQIITIKSKKGKTLRIPKSNKRVEAWQHKAMAALCEQWGASIPIRIPVNLVIRSHGPWKSTSGNIPDASNLYQAPEDALQAAGVLEDDRLVESHDGSRRVCMCDTCDERPFYKAGPKKGSRKPDCGAVKKCPFPHVEIVIEPLT